MIDCTIPAVSIQGYQDQANNTELLPTLLHIALTT